MYKNYLLACFLVFGITRSAVAQTPPPFILHGTQVIPISSKHTGKAHELVVILPASYSANPEKKYPVLYYIDAYWDTPLLVSTYGNLIFDKETPEFIMVGLSYPSTANYGEERMADLTYSVAPGIRSGKGDAYLKFLTQEVAPLIESKFRGEKTDRVISGSSLGGLFALGAAYKEPGFFAGHIAISPAVLWDNNALAKMDQAYAKDNKALKARMFISYGTAEHPGFTASIIDYQKQMAARKYDGLALANYSMEGIAHASVKSDGYVRGLMWVWKHKKPAN